MFTIMVRGSLCRVRDVLGVYCTTVPWIRPEAATLSGLRCNGGLSLNIYYFPKKLSYQPSYEATF